MKATKTTKTLTFTRVIAFPFLMVVNTVFLIYLWLDWGYRFLRYGGEVVAYDKAMNKKTLADLFDKVEEMIQSVNEMDEIDGSESFLTTLHEMNDVGLLRDYLKENEDVIKEIRKLI